MARAAQQHVANGDTITHLLHSIQIILSLNSLHNQMTVRFHDLTGQENLIQDRKHLQSTIVSHLDFDWHV